MTIDKNTVWIIVAALAIGYWFGSDQPQQPQRPVLTWVARTARSLLWIAAFADPPPATSAQPKMVQTAIGHDGYPQIDHARGL